MQPAGQATSSRFAPPGGNILPTAVPDPAFVINLCASTTPMALPRPDHPQLKRFTFFISRRREDGRERFRLHMGYFSSQEDAEQLLELVREIYPAAWAGVAPGQRLRAAAAGGALSDTTAGTLPQPAAPPAARPAPASMVPAAVAAPAATAAPATVAPARPVSAVAAPATPSVAAAPAPAAQPATTQPTATRPAASQPNAAASAPLAAAVQSMHSVRAAIDALEESAPPRASALPPPPAPPELRTVPVARPVLPATPVPTAAPATAPLTSRQVLGVLETPATASAPRSEVAGYAVQLLWSVQPIEMSGVPQLAIFSAYTLYGAAGNRDGRRWYGLRLGFFTDAVSAKQVANYVRSEFAAVSIVPVSARERERALAAAPRTPLPDAALAPKKTAVNIASSGEFRLLDEKRVVSATGAANPARPPRSAPGKRAKLRPAAAGADGAAAPKRRPPLSLEETLEILGAGELKLQDGRDDPVNDSGIRHLRMEAMQSRRASRFSKLMDRLSERFGGS